MKSNLKRRILMKKSKIVKIVAFGLLISFFASILIQFGCNMLFVKSYAAETTKGGDGKLTEMPPL